MATVQERHPELFRPISSESPRGKKRTVPMQVLCLGFNRTGTSSMCAALEQLGIRCWHSFHLLSTNFGDNEMWQDAINRKFFNAGTPFGRGEFDQLLHVFGGISSDTPAIAFSEDLITAYPEAKVVLVERDIESWYKSYMHSIIGNMFNPFVRLVYYFDRSYIYPIGRVQETTVEGWLGIKSKKDAELKAKEKYREHYALVRRITPKERLLEFKLSEGWEPLSEFLSKPVPSTPFPHLNDQKWFDEKVSILMKIGITKLLYKISPIIASVLAAVAGWYWWNTSYGKP